MFLQGNHTYTYYIYIYTRSAHVTLAHPWKIMAPGGHPSSSASCGSWGFWWGACRGKFVVEKFQEKLSLQWSIYIYTYLYNAPIYGLFKRPYSISGWLYLYIGRVFFDFMEVGRVIQCTQHEIWLIYVKYLLATLSLMFKIRINQLLIEITSICSICTNKSIKIPLFSWLNMWWSKSTIES